MPDRRGGRRRTPLKRTRPRTQIDIRFGFGARAIRGGQNWRHAAGLRFSRQVLPARPKPRTQNVFYPRLSAPLAPQRAAARDAGAPRKGKDAARHVLETGLALPALPGAGAAQHRVIVQGNGNQKDPPHRRVRHVPAHPRRRSHESPSRFRPGPSARRMARWSPTP